MSALVVGISGFGGAGKSTYARWLQSQFEAYSYRAALVGIDGFMVAPEKLADGTYGPDFDHDRLEHQVLAHARDGSFEYETYDWYEQRLGEVVKVEMVDVVIIEGVRLFKPEWMSSFDLSIWVNTDRDVARLRGMTRDRDEYRNLIVEFWDHVWTPRDVEHFDRYRPDTLADFVVDNN